VVGDIALPVDVLELKHLKTKDKQPVRVQVESVDQLTLMRLVGPPGSRPEESRDGDKSPEEQLQAIGTLHEYGRKLIEMATCFVMETGEEVRPAFWFDPNTPRHPLSIPGRLLHFEDVTDTIIAILRVSGYLGGAAEETFRGDERDSEGAGA
jgi:hypothetical protein